MNPEQLANSIGRHLETIYQSVEGVAREDHEQLCNELIELMGLQQATTEPTRYSNHWDEQDCILISYGDSVLQPDEMPLQSLKRFLDRYVEGCINGVHILPFYP
jgi:sucrose phosphorylase